MNRHEKTRLANLKAKQRSEDVTDIGEQLEDIVEDVVDVVKAVKKRAKKKAK